VIRAVTVALVLAWSVAATAGGDVGRRSPLLPAAWDVDSEAYWVLGLALERAGTNVVGDDVLRDQLVGLSFAFRWWFLEPHLRLMASPTIGRYQNTRALAGGGLRLHASLFDFDFSYGGGAHIEVRLDDHYWLAGVTPFEAGMTVWDRGSWRIQVFVGARFIVAGELVNSFMIDPNGFNNENARDELNRTLDSPWEGVVSVTFGRRVE
jgi:hypothetical protein